MTPRLLITAVVAAAIGASVGGVTVAEASGTGVSKAARPCAAATVAGKTGSSAAVEPAIGRLAAQLRISVSRAQWVFDQLNGLARPGEGVDPNSSGFARLAAALGTTPAQLPRALDTWKQGLRASSPSPSGAAPSPSR